MTGWLSRASFWLITGLLIASPITFARADDDDQATEALWLADHAKLVHKVKTLVVGDVDLKDVTVKQAIDFLRHQSKLSDPDHVGINFVYRGDTELDSLKFSVKLDHPTVEDVLNHIPMIRREIGDFVVEIKDGWGDYTFSRTFHVSDNILAINPSMLIDKNRLVYDVQPLFTKKGIRFRPGDSATYVLPAKTLTVISGDEENFIRIDELLVFGFKNVK